MDFHKEADELEELAKQIELEKQRLKQVFEKKGMVLPDTLYRIHYIHPETVCDKDGYVVSQESLEFPDQHSTGSNRTVPIIHEDDLELIERYFAFPEFQKSGKHFTLLHLDTWRLRLIGADPNTPLLARGEYFGQIPRKAILKEESFAWVNDGKPLPPKLKALNDPVIQASEGWSPIPVVQLQEMK